MSQIQFENTEKTTTKKVRYEGTDTLRGGQCLCYNADYGTATASDGSRAYKAEKPAAANVDNFAGVVTEKYDGKTGPCAVEIYVPTARGQKVGIWTDASVTLDTTNLFLQVGSYAAGASGAVRIGKAMQTVDRSSTAGTCQGRLDFVAAQGADDQEVAASAAFTDAIWRNFPLTALRSGQLKGTFVEYEPGTNPAPAPTFAEFDSAAAGITLTKGVTVATSEQLQLVLDSTENDGIAMQVPGKIDLDGKPWAIEVVLDLVSVADTHQNALVSLSEALTLTAVVPITATGTLSDHNHLGFQQAEGDGNAVDVVYKADGESAVTHQAGVKVPTANVNFTVAFHYNGTTIQPYVDGVAKTVISAADIADLTDVFPTGDVYLTIGSVAAASASASDGVNVHAFRVAQPD